MLSRSKRRPGRRDGIKIQVAPALQPHGVETNSSNAGDMEHHRFDLARKIHRDTDAQSVPRSTATSPSFVVAPSTMPAELVSMCSVYCNTSRTTLVVYSSPS